MLIHDPIVLSCIGSPSDLCVNFKCFRWSDFVGFGVGSFDFDDQDGEAGMGKLSVEALRRLGEEAVVDFSRR
jgi:hypothetical protein